MSLAQVDSLTVSEIATWSAYHKIPDWVTPELLAAIQ